MAKINFEAEHEEEIDFLKSFDIVYDNGDFNSSVCIKRRELAGLLRSYKLQSLCKHKHIINDFEEKTGFCFDCGLENKTLYNG